MKNVYDLYAEVERKQTLSQHYAKRARKLPKHGPRRQAVDQLILLLSTEIRMIEWIIDEKLKYPPHMSDESIEENSAWLK